MKRTIRQRDFGALTLLCSCSLARKRALQCILHNSRKRLSGRHISKDKGGRVSPMKNFPRFVQTLRVYKDTIAAVPGLLPLSFLPFTLPSSFGLSHAFSLNAGDKECA